jgi:hypothetical protein
LLVGLMMSPAGARSDEATFTPERSAFYVEGSWLDREGGILPFRSDQEAIAFLQTAEVVTSEEIPGTSGRPLELVLEKNGARARAIFRTVDVERDKMEYAQEHARGFRDHYLYEVAAYELSRLLGLDNVPPATLRTLDGRKGSIQLWVESAKGVEERLSEGIDEQHQQLWLFQKQNMAVFDSLIYNFDRNPGNILLDSRGKVWFVDHTRAFKILPSLSGRREIKIVERQLWRNLQRVTPEVVRERLAPYLKVTEIDALLVRRDKLVKLIGKRIAKHGEQAILFEFVRS